MSIAFVLVLIYCSISLNFTDLMKSERQQNSSGLKIL
jgi:hypothetical protein